MGNLSLSPCVCVCVLFQVLVSFINAILMYELGGPSYLLAYLFTAKLPVLQRAKENVSFGKR